MYLAFPTYIILVLGLKKAMFFEETRNNICFCKYFCDDRFFDKMI